MNNKIFISVATAIIVMLLAYPYTKIINHSERIIALEKDKEYLIQIFNERLNSRMMQP